MNGVKQLLLDSNIVVFALKGELQVHRYLGKYNLCISIISEMELLSTIFEDSRQENLFRDFISKCHILGIDYEVKEKAVEVRKKWKASLPDAIIAATAISKNLEFYTADRGFNRVQDPKFKLSFFQA